MGSYKNIFILVFSVALGMVALALLFKGSQQSSDLRSRASEQVQIYKQWEFNGTSTEQWTSEQSPLTVKNGTVEFTLSSLANTDLIEQGSVIDLPPGKKQINVSLKISPAKVFGRSGSCVNCDDVYQPPNGTIPHGGTGFGSYIRPSASVQPTGSQIVTSNLVQLSYQLKGSPRFEAPLDVRVVGDGALHNYVVTLPQASAIKIVRMKIAFTKAEESLQQVSIDWIRVQGAVTSTTTTSITTTQQPSPPPLTPTVTPSVSCNLPQCAAPPKGCRYIRSVDLCTCGTLQCSISPTVYYPP